MTQNNAALQAVQSKIVTAYGGDPTAISPAIIAAIMQLIQSLISGCAPAPALAQVKTHPRIARSRIFFHVWSHQNMLQDTTVDVQKATDVIFTIGSQSTPEEATAFLSAIPAEDQAVGTNV